MNIWKDVADMLKMTSKCVEDAAESTKNAMDAYKATNESVARAGEAAKRAIDAIHSANQHLEIAAAELKKVRGDAPPKSESQSVEGINLPQVEFTAEEVDRMRAAVLKWDEQQAGKSMN